MIDISFIIPAYNCGDSISRAVKSIERYSQKINYEILIVENGSTDNTNFVINQLAKENNAIKILHSKKGVSKARNMGLTSALGRWLWFVDADDCITVNVQEIISCKDIINTDLIIGNYKVNKNVINVSNSIKTLQGIEFKQYLLNMISIPNKYMTVWNKLFRAKVIKKNHLKFDNTLEVAEDSQFLFDYLQKIDNLGLFNQDIYQYYTSNNSTVRSLQLEDINKYTVAMKKMRSRIGNDIVLNDAIYKYMCSNFSIAMVRILFASKGLSRFKKRVLLKKYATQSVCKEAFNHLCLSDLRYYQLLPSFCLKFNLFSLAGCMFQFKADLNFRRENNV